jgi:hypothetical protein
MRGKVIGGEGKGPGPLNGTSGVLVTGEGRTIGGTMIGITQEERIEEGIKVNYYLF